MASIHQDRIQVEGADIPLAPKAAQTFRLSRSDKTIASGSHGEAAARHADAVRMAALQGAEGLIEWRRCMSTDASMRVGQAPLCDRWLDRRAVRVPTPQCHLGRSAAVGDQGVPHSFGVPA